MCVCLFLFVRVDCLRGSGAAGRRLDWGIGDGGLAEDGGTRGVSLCVFISVGVEG